jgi:hypothetical protein
VAIPRPGIGIIGRLRDWTEPATYRMVCEAALQGGVGGLGRLGGDFWPLPMGKDGRYVPLCDGYAAVGPLNSVAAMTSPGPEGAEFNGRLEMFREGVQAAEAIICLQRAAGSGKVGGDLAARIGDHLDERARYYLRARSNNSFYGAAHWLALGDWQERDGRLFALCAEVAGGGK